MVTSNADSRIISPLLPTSSGRPHFIGSGDGLMSAMFKKYREVELDLRLGSVLAYRLMAETIESGAFGLKLPIELWQISEGGLRRLDQGQIEEISKTVEAIRKHEMIVFEKHLTVSMSH